MASKKSEREQEKAKVSTTRLNWLRAAVLGANDGIVSVSSIIVGVAGATNDRGVIFTAGMAGLVAGALSMAVGEYVSVSSQSDAEKSFIAKEKRRLRSNPERELNNLAEVYREKGLSDKTATLVAKELTAKDPVKAHLDAQFSLDEEDISSPSQAAFASFVSFTVGGLIPLVAVLAATANWRVGVTFVAVLIALCFTGYLSATVGGASRKRAVVRVVLGGALAMALTFIVGSLFGTAIS